MHSSSSHKHPTSFRLENDLEKSVNQWLKLNPGLGFSKLVNLAIREFISHPHTLQAVETKVASDKEVLRVGRHMMKQHKDMLDRLK